MVRNHLKWSRKWQFAEQLRINRGNLKREATEPKFCLSSVVKFFEKLRTRAGLLATRLLCCRSAAVLTIKDSAKRFCDRTEGVGVVKHTRRD